MTYLQDDHITSKASCCFMLRSVLIECCLHRTSATWRSHECYQQARKPESSDTPTASPTMCKNANVMMVYWFYKVHCTSCHFDTLLLLTGIFLISLFVYN